jgi:hypothetical protein
MENNDNNLDQIRPPDPVKRETLIEQFGNLDNNINNYNYNYNFPDYNEYNDIDNDIEFKRVLQLSIDEFDLLAQQTESKCETERDKRIDILYNIKQRLLKVKTFDKCYNETYEMIISIIEMYEMEVINIFAVNKESYTAIFNITKLVRFTTDEIELLKDIIIQL